MTLPRRIFSGRYELRSILGTGGMGEVYLAQDMNLHRPVAIKLLPPEYTADEERLRRFEQEAYAASALNHHGLITIYEIGRIDSAPFIVMEYVEGQTLRQRMKHGRLSVHEALDIAMQVAEALQSAHAKDIVHRDIKPENIMLRKDNYVKVLDFGLAKLGEGRSQASSTPEASTMTNINTGQGAVLGTAVYMSPEQLRGLEIDNRTDIWSLGVVLYEMLTVTTPFKGHTTGEVIVSILEREPEPLVGKWPEVPVALQRIINKALQKNRHERYQTAGELLTDLRQFGRQFESGSIPQHEGEYPVTVDSESHPVRSARTESAEVLITATQQATTAEQLSETRVQPVSAPRSSGAWRNYLLAAVLALSLLGAVASVGYRALKERVERSPSASLKFNQIALPGNVKEAAISPDGKYVASVMDEGGRQSLHVMELSTFADIMIAEPSTQGYTGITFSPDGTYIYYLESGAETTTLYRVSKFGGARRKILSNVNTSVTFSPDGSRIAFVRYDMREQTSTLVIANADGSDEKPVVVRGRPEFFTLSPEQAAPAWSPDGQVIACPTMDTSGGIPQMNIEAFNVEDGTTRRINTKPWYDIAKSLWLADGTGLVVAASSESLMQPLRLSLLSYPGGEVRDITNDVSHYKKVSLTGDSSTLLAVTSDVTATLWLAPANDAASARTLNSGNQDGIWGVDWLPEGRLVYSSKSGGENLHIWVKETGGTGQRQLTFARGDNYQPAVSKDGRYIVFVSSRAGALNIWRMNADGTQPFRLTDGKYEDTPQVTPDGQWVIYHTNGGVWKVSIEGGEPVLLLKKNTMHPVISPDGTMLACYTLGQTPDSAWTLEVFSLTDMSMIRRLELPRSVSIGSGLRWMPGGRALSYVSSAGGASNLWTHPLDGMPKQLTDFKDAQLFTFAWSADGKQVVCVRGIESVRVVLIKDFS